jgi:hypothetical protein
VRLGLDTPVDSDTAETLRQAILDAQADAEGYLGRPIVPTTRTARGLWPGVGTSWTDQIDDDVISGRLGHARGLHRQRAADRHLHRHLPGRARRPQRPGAAPDRPVRRRGGAERTGRAGHLARAGAAARRDDERVHGRPDATFAAPSRGGGGEPGSNRPGALPTLESLYPWKRGSVFQRRGERDLLGCPTTPTTRSPLGIPMGRLLPHLDDTEPIPLPPTPAVRSPGRQGGRDVRPLRQQLRGRVGRPHRHPDRDPGLAVLAPLPPPGDP